MACYRGRVRRRAPGLLLLALAGGELPASGNAVDGQWIHARPVILTAPRAELIARIDLAEGHGNRVTPVDYKRGTRFVCGA